ncbi:MAG: AbrB/MazE/SpoVT family DNA-binding domain-containing protein [Thaumarchaeota archaeon]|nr:AbrB/MazE/SpoVT family DNA-binding domain-containing protein [Nitrososphaerota archaeon]
MTYTGKVAKKRALYPPKKIMDKLDMNEGQLVNYRIEDKKLVVEPVRDPLELALKSKKWGKTTVKEFEEESEKEQRELYG